MYDMTVYLGRDRQRTAQRLTATHATVSELTKKIQGRGHKLYMDITSRPQTYSMIWPRSKFTVVAL